jgi:hypothetical protein
VLIGIVVKLTLESPVCSSSSRGTSCYNFCLTLPLLTEKEHTLDFFKTLTQATWVKQSLEVIFI